jgi:hypothetical protein
MALALCALAYGCPAQDDVSVNVSKESGGMAGMGGAPAGSGGTPATAPMGSGGMADPCASLLPPGYDGFLGLQAQMCRISMNDPLVQQVRAYSMMHMNAPLPPVGEGHTPSTACDFYRVVVYVDTKYPDQYTVCPAWCQLLSDFATKAYQDHLTCCRSAPPGACKS